MALTTPDSQRRNRKTSAINALSSSIRKWLRRRPILRPRIGLALSGGFAHGLAHLGVLKVLAENDVPIDALAGTSVGSLVAAVFASGCPLQEMIAASSKIRWGSFGRWTFARLGLAMNGRLEIMLKKVMRCTSFEDLRIPLAVVAADISTGEPVVFRRGELLTPLRASCSFPGLFVPILHEGRMLVDGALVANVPVEAVRALGVDRITAVNLRSGVPRPAPTNIFQVIGQAFQVARGRNQNAWRDQSDVIIEPDVSSFKWDEFDRAWELIAAGETAARRALPQIRALLRKPAPDQPAWREQPAPRLSSSPEEAQ